MEDTRVMEQEGVDPNPSPGHPMEEPLWIQCHMALCIFFVLTLIGVSSLHPRWLLSKLGKHGLALAATLTLIPFMLPLEPIALYPDPWDDVVLRTIMATTALGVSALFATMFDKERR